MHTLFTIIRYLVLSVGIIVGIFGSLALCVVNIPGNITPHLIWMAAAFAFLTALIGVWNIVTAYLAEPLGPKTVYSTIASSFLYALGPLVFIFALSIATRTNLWDMNTVLKDSLNVTLDFSSRLTHEPSIDYPLALLLTICGSFFSMLGIGLVETPEEAPEPRHDAAHPANTHVDNILAECDKQAEAERTKLIIAQHPTEEMSSLPALAQRTQKASTISFAEFLKTRN